MSEYIVKAMSDLHSNVSFGGGGGGGGGSKSSSGTCRPGTRPTTTTEKAIIAGTVALVTTFVPGGKVVQAAARGSLAAVGVTASFGCVSTEAGPNVPDYFSP